MDLLSSVWFNLLVVYFVRGLAYDNKPRRTHLLNLPTRSRLQILPRNTHLQKLIYEISPKTTNLQELNLTKLTYEIHLQELNYRNYKSYVGIHIYKSSSTKSLLREQTYENSLTKLSYETHLQELNYEYSLTIIHSPLRNLSYKILPRNTHLQKN